MPLFGPPEIFEMDPHLQSFYEGNYGKLIHHFQEKSTQKSLSPQDQHMQLITKYLYNNINPISGLQELSQQILTSSTCADGWPISSSYGLIQYHSCIFHYYCCNFSECLRILDQIWHNIDLYDYFFKICVSILTIEICIITNSRKNLEKVKECLENFPEDRTNVRDETQRSREDNARTRKSNLKIAKLKEAPLRNEDEIIKIDDEVIQPKLGRIKLYFKQKGLNESTCNSLIERIQFASLRLSISQSVYRNSNNTTLEIFNHSKPPFTIYQLLPLFSATLSLGHMDNFSNLITQFNSQHFAIYNASAVLELHAKHYSNALLYFSKAFNCRSNQNLDHPYEQVAYGIGLSLLLKNKPRKAFKYLYGLIPVMHDFPYLWLRLSEACIMHFKNHVKKLRVLHQYSPSIARKLSTPKRSYIILPISDYQLFLRYPPEIMEDKHHFDGELNLTLEFADICASKAIELCNQSQTTLKARAFLLRSYIALELGDGEKAIDFSKKSQDFIVSQASQLSQTGSEALLSQLYTIYSCQGHLLIGDYSAVSGPISKLMFDLSFNSKSNTEDNILMGYLTAARVYQMKPDTKTLQQIEKLSMGRLSHKPIVILAKVALKLQDGKTHEALELLNNKNNSD